MITKLKWLKAYFTRDILPAAGVTIGQILYTSTNATGRRTQYVIDLDANTVDVTTINAYASPGDQTSKPGAITVISGLLAPQDDVTLYIPGGAALPLMAKIIESVFTQSIDDGLTITAVNVITGVTVDGSPAVIGTNVTVESVTASGLTLNTGTGAVTLNDGNNIIPGTYTLDYTVENLNEPTDFVEGLISITVANVVIVASVGSATCTAAEGTAGKLNVVNVLTGDTIKGIAATTSNVVITKTSGDSALVLTTGTGAVAVAALTAPGTYHLTYRIANINNTTNYQEAVITVTVSA